MSSMHCTANDHLLPGHVSALRVRVVSLCHSCLVRRGGDVIMQHKYLCSQPGLPLRCSEYAVALLYWIVPWYCSRRGFKCQFYFEKILDWVTACKLRVLHGSMVEELVHPGYNAASGTDYCAVMLHGIPEERIFQHIMLHQELTV